MGAASGGQGCSQRRAPAFGLMDGHRLPWEFRVLAETVGDDCLPGGHGFAERAALGGGQALPPDVALVARDAVPGERPAGVVQGYGSVVGLQQSARLLCGETDDVVRVRLERAFTHKPSQRLGLRAAMLRFVIEPSCLERGRHLRGKQRQELDFRWCERAGVVGADCQRAERALVYQRRDSYRERHVAGRHSRQGAIPGRIIGHDHRLPLLKRCSGCAFTRPHVGWEGAPFSDAGKHSQHARSCVPHAEGGGVPAKQFPGPLHHQVGQLGRVQNAANGECDVVQRLERQFGQVAVGACLSADGRAVRRWPKLAPAASGGLALRAAIPCG